MSKIDSPTFCIYPYTHLNLKANAKLAICNRSDPMGRMDQAHSFSDFWKGRSVQEMRDQQARGEWPRECAACQHLEESGSTSYRQEAFDKESIHWGWYQDALNRGYFESKDFKIRELELRFGNQCNLKCKMCSPKFSNHWENEVRSNNEFVNWVKEDKENFNIYDISRLETKEQIKQTNKLTFESLDDNVFDLDRVMFSGGEPLIQIDHYRCLEKLLPNAKNISLEYSTNLNYISFERYNVLDLWKQFKKVIIKVSIDADPLIYSFVRSGGDIKDVEANIAKIQNQLNPKQFNLMGTCTTSIYNIGRLPEIMKYFSSIGVFTHTSIVEYPTFLSPQVLPTKLKDNISEHIQSFINNIEELPIHDFISNRKQKQIDRTLKWTKNCLNYLNGNDQSELWPDFLKFNSFFDKDHKQLLSYYPKWSEFI